MNDYPLDVRAKYVTSPPLVHALEYDYGVIFKGTREALIATGHFRPEWFPGEPGMRKTTSTVHCDGREHWILRTSPRLYRACRKFTDDEVAERKALALQRAQLEAMNAELASVSSNAGEHRAKTLAQLQELAVIMSTIGGRTSGGYRLDEPTRVRLGKATLALLKIASEAGVTFDANARREELAAIYDRHGAPMKSDEAFARFMDGLASEGSAIDGAPT